VELAIAGTKLEILEEEWVVMRSESIKDVEAGLE
jgi:hypothetical protein